MKDIICIIKKRVKLCAEHGLNYELQKFFNFRNNVVTYKRDIDETNMYCIDILMTNYSKEAAEKEFAMLFQQIKHLYFNCYIKESYEENTIFEWVSLYDDETGFLIKINYH